jgi:hypothetical protein
MNRYFSVIAGGSGRWCAKEVTAQGMTVSEYIYGGYIPRCDWGKWLEKVTPVLRRQVEGTAKPDMSNPPRGGSKFEVTL